jgi:MFS transporter, CP family, cyanate transporter
MNWLPTVLTSSAGVAQATAATMLSMYNLVGIPHSLLVPNILARTRHPYYVIVFASACLLVGYLGLVFYPAFAWGWIVPAGLGLMCIPIGLTLINLRSRTEDGTTALSGFVQGVGYLLAAPGPLVVAQLHARTGEWTVAFGFLMATALVAAIAGAVAVRPRFIEDA